MNRDIYKIEVVRLIEIYNYIHKQLGNKFSENAYWEVLEFELDLLNIPYKRKVKYLSDNNKSKKRFEFYFVCYSKIFVALTATPQLTKEDESLFVYSLQRTECPIYLSPF